MLLIYSKGFFLQKKKKKKADPQLIHQKDTVCGFFVKHFNKSFSFLWSICTIRIGIELLFFFL